MTLYEMIQEISNIITPDTNDFFTYVIHTSDNNGGFLRTRYYWSEECIEDFTLKARPDKVLVTSMGEINVEDLKKMDEETAAKLQITYTIANPSFEDSEWDIGIGYNYVYIFDLKNRTYHMQIGKDIWI